jgi:hypothetical protein
MTGVLCDMEHAEETTRSTERKEAARAFLIAFVFHALLAGLALQITLRPLKDETRELEMVLSADPARSLVATRPAPRARHPQSISAPTRPTRAPGLRSRLAGSKPVLPEHQKVDAPHPAYTADRVEIPAPCDSLAPTQRVPAILRRDVTRPEMTEQEALAELDGLLQAHPEFRHAILREMLAGDARVPSGKWMLDPKAADLLKSIRFLSMYEYELMKSGGGGYTGPYDPVHGFDRDKRKGFLVDPVALLKFMKNLLGL